MTNSAALINLVHMYLRTEAELSEQIPRSGIFSLKGKLPSTGTVPLRTSTATDESAYIITALPTEYTLSRFSICDYLTGEKWPLGGTFDLHSSYFKCRGHLFIYLKTIFTTFHELFVHVFC